MKWYAITMILLVGATLWLIYMSDDDHHDPDCYP